jgi:hypothetical protein
VLGAPYWFDLLRRLTTFAGVSPGGRPLPAAQDPQSATSAMTASMAGTGQAQLTIAAPTPPAGGGSTDVLAMSFVRPIARPTA